MKSWDGVVFDIAAGLKAFEAKLDRFSKQQLPFAVAQAVNEVAQFAVADEQANERTVLDRPREFTQKALRVTRASKAKPMAVVWMMDTTARYLEPYEEGGVNVLNDNQGRLLKPARSASDILDRYGNIPRRYLAQAKGRSDMFVGEIKTKNGPVFGLWQRTTDQKRVQVVHTRKDGTVRVSKTAKALNSSGRLKLLIKFTDPHPIAEKNRLHWFDVAQRSIDRHFPAAMQRAMAKALSTAR